MHPLKFEYERVGDSFFPVINVELIHEDKSIITKAYVDSGAMYSIFNADLADVLELDYKKGKKIYPLGIGGHICANINDIILKIEDAEIPCKVLFSDEFVVKFNLLGRIGLFDRFRICFDDQERSLYLYKKDQFS